MTWSTRRIMLYTSLHSSAFGRFTLVPFWVLHTRPLLGVSHLSAFGCCTLVRFWAFHTCPLLGVAHSSAFGHFTLVRFWAFHTSPLLRVAHSSAFGRCTQRLHNQVYAYQKFGLLDHPTEFSHVPKTLPQRQGWSLPCV